MVSAPASIPAVGAATFDALLQFAEMMSTPILMVDFDGKVQAWNKAAARVTGHKPEKVLHRQLTNIVSPEYKAATRETIKTFAETPQKAAVNLELTLVTNLKGSVDIAFHTMAWKAPANKGQAAAAGGSADAAAAKADSTPTEGLLCIGQVLTTNFGMKYRIVSSTVYNMFNTIYSYKTR